MSWECVITWLSPKYYNIDCGEIRNCFNILQIGKQHTLLTLNESDRSYTTKENFRDQKTVLPF